MKHLISNSLNEKSIINNILADSLNNVILLTGPFGVGKTEFAKEIARMLVCQNFSSNGYCEECEACQAEIVSGANSFNTDIHLLNMQKVSYEEMVQIVAQATTKLRNKKEVYIFDEFHLVEKKAQELWLAETSKLDDCYIIMTTTDKRAISDGIISRAIQISMKLLAPLEASQLIKENYYEATQATVQAIVKSVGGTPRELINMAKYYSNAGLTQEEIIEHLSNVNQEEIILCLEALTNRELFFETLKTVRTMNHYTVKKGLQDLLWDWLGATPSERANITYLSKFNEQQIMKFIISANQDPFLTILNMFNAVTIKPPVSEDLQTLNSDKGSVTIQKEEKFTTEKRW
ncbi:AAA family ATPase [Lysinibacillus xylanilyticus]|uniref:AAA family ATPase n=1 Tax=Lysinibacillus xylanilyticus TaxID=582475 RepID=UPI0036DC2D5C